MLNPFDGVVPYRLEMQAKLKVDDKKNLYEFWGDSLYNELRKESNVILNLASKEYLPMKNTLLPLGISFSFFDMNSIANLSV